MEVSNISSCIKLKSSGSIVRRLLVKDILKFAKTKVDIHEYLPEFEYNKELYRQRL